MKRSRFRQQSVAEVAEKQRAKRLSLKEKSATQPKVPKTNIKRSKVAKRAKLPALPSLRNKADSLLTPNCKKTNPSCECCGQPAQVGHHWIEKSRSSFLRYDMRNLVALCNSCHAKIHNRFGNSVVGGYDVATVIINKRGIEWKNQLDIDSKTYQKVDRDYYNQAILDLKELLEKP